MTPAPHTNPTLVVNFYYLGLQASHSLIPPLPLEVMLTLNGESNIKMRLH